MIMADDKITFRGERRLWLDFVYQVKKERLRVWDVLGKLIEGYLKKKSKKMLKERQAGGE